MKFLPRYRSPQRMLVAAGIAASALLVLVAVRFSTGSERTVAAVAAPAGTEPEPAALPRSAAGELVPPPPLEPDPIAAAAAAELAETVPPAPSAAPEVHAPAPALAAAAPKPEPLQRVRLPGGNERIPREKRADRVRRLKGERRASGRVAPDELSADGQQRPRKNRGR